MRDYIYHSNASILIHSLRDRDTFLSCYFKVIKEHQRQFISTEIFFIKNLNSAAREHRAHSLKATDNLFPIASYHHKIIF